MERNRTTDEVWRRLKQWADRYARSQTDLPSERECNKQAREIAVMVLGILPEEAMAFYAREASAMIDDIRRARYSALQ